MTTVVFFGTRVSEGSRVRSFMVTGKVDGIKGWAVGGVGRWSDRRYF